MNAYFSWQHAIQKAKIEPTTKLVCYTIATHMANDGSGCFPSYQQIADESGLGRRTVIYHVELAVKAGLLEVEGRERDNGSHSSNLYKPNMPTGGSAPAAPPSAPAALGGSAPAAPLITTPPSLTTQTTIPPNPPMGGATTGQSENQQIKKGANNGTKTSFERQFGEITETTIPERPADFGGNPAEWLNFASHHAAKGNRFAGIKGWKLAWQKWNRNAINWGPRGGNNPQPSKFVAIYNQTLARGLEREGVDGGQPPEWLRD